MQWLMRLALTLALSPRERERVVAAPEKVSGQMSSYGAGKISPSPWGEGRGEGERWLATELFRLRRRPIRYVCRTRARFVD
jgi:hypothetical protein